jgi:hypothetical protein
MKRVFILIFTVALTTALMGQGRSEQTPSLSQRLFYGGSFGLQFGTVTNIEVSPVVGFWLLPRVAVAAGPSYQYYKDPYGKTSLYGGKAFMQFMLIQDLNNVIPLGLNLGIFVQGQYEGLSLERAFFDSSPDLSGRIYNGTFLAGAGVSQPLGPRAFMNFTFLWPFNQSEYTLYTSPEINVSFYF